MQAVETAAKAATPPAPPVFTTLVDEPGRAAGDIFLTDTGDTAATMIADGAGNSLWTSTGAKS